MLKTLSIAFLLAAAACGSSKPNQSAPANAGATGSGSGATTAASCCCQMEMHTSGWRTREQCEGVEGGPGDGQCGDEPQATCGANDGGP